MGKLKSNMKKSVGYLEEETGEALRDREMARAGRELRNEGRIEKGEQPKTGEPGSGSRTGSGSGRGSSKYS
jgi:hypothetical protein